MAKNGFTMSKRMVIETISDGTGNASETQLKTLNRLDCGKKFLIEASGNVRMVLPSASVDDGTHGVEASGWFVDVEFTVDAATGVSGLGKDSATFQLDTKYDNVANNVDTIDGMIIAGDHIDAASNEVAFFTGSGTNNQLLMRQGNGFKKGTSLRLYTKADQVWRVKGEALMTGTLATPFATES
tara:strand:- start:112 stop:663 length:552 start_codon:yes stop_codon:yes gene_type:complete